MTKSNRTAPSNQPAFPDPDTIVRDWLKTVERLNAAEQDNLAAWQNAATGGLQAAEPSFLSLGITPKDKESLPYCSQNPWNRVDLGDLRDGLVTGHCPRSRFFLGECVIHGHRQFFALRCKRRDCLECSELWRLKKAKRIDYGIGVLGPCKLLVFTFGTYRAEQPDFKPEAVRKLGHFIEWLRKLLGVHFAYTLTWELQRRGRLHANLIINYGGWLPWQKCKKQWGARLTIENVYDARGLSYYMVKCGNGSKALGSLGEYCVKKGYQELPAEWGRTISFSRNWPKMPATSGFMFRSPITWQPLSLEGRINLLTQYRSGEVIEVATGIYRHVTHECKCFEVVPVTEAAVSVLAVFKKKE